MEGLTFSLSYVLAPTPPQPLPSVSSTDDTQEDWQRVNTCRREREWKGWARSRIMRPQESLVLYKLFNTLWYRPSLYGILTFKKWPVYVVWRGYQICTQDIHSCTPTPTSTKPSSFHQLIHLHRARYWLCDLRFAFSSTLRVLLFC